MLDERKAAILRAVVEEYIHTAQPVGSGHVARTSGLGVSPATVRNEMAALEHDGYLAQPHTSAGRIPTDKGYREFVDHLGDSALAIPEAQQVRTFFDRAHGELEQMLADTSRLLANLTSYAAVVVGAPTEQATVRSVQLVQLAPTVVLAVAVLANGTIEKHTIELGDEIGDADIDDAAALVSGALIGKTLTKRAEVTGAPAGAAAALAAHALGAFAAAHTEASVEQVYVGGTSQVAAAFDAVETVGKVLTILEQQLVVVTLLRDVLDRGLSVAIGSETGMEPLAACSLIVAPYQVGGEAAGTIGVLGPTRMDYAKALASVALVSEDLGRRLSEG
jgi:heat-inducible transcriptional repressor